ncbi:hypothetical protein F4556_006220 [Kitasatospora gansuensis]|uniref:Uncharacterized protein n=1 Tax=Kitasatospora gansuensis TaxID=258050 RepID=A0A7W7WL55_9ACTN|nr:hypothetical protein [Kitasatospora gansuensis]MBB4950685.1 hypothetical protein [Kitasatospora gansuensis]
MTTADRTRRVNSAEIHIQAGDRTLIFVPNRERARRRALILCQLAAGRRRRKRHRESAA